MSNVRIDYEKVTGIIRDKMEIIGLPEGYSLFVEQERQFVKRKDLEPNAVFIVVSFGQAEYNSGQATCPVYLDCLSEENTFNVARELLTTFAVNNNLTEASGIKQVWGSPIATTKFNGLGTGYRASFYLTGSIVVGSSTANYVATLLWVNGDGEEIEVPFLSFQDAYTASLSPQAFPDNDGFVQSYTQYGTYSFTFATFYDASDLLAEVDDLRYTGTPSVNSSFDFIIVDARGNRREISGMRLLNVAMASNKGEGATISLTFSR